LDDIDKLVKVRFDYFAAEKWEVSALQRETIEASLRQYYSEYLNSDFFAAFAEEGDEVASVAFLAISRKPANLSFPTGKTGTILNVLTYPEYRGKGYATKAMSSLIYVAEKQNLSYIELSSSESGKALYKKLGFVESSKSEGFTQMKLLLCHTP
jgi:ribosomal protein S18 acetylase RimI-like enzyme